MLLTRTVAAYWYQMCIFICSSCRTAGPLL